MCACQSLCVSSIDIALHIIGQQALLTDKDAYVDDWYADKFCSMVWGV